MSKFEVAVFVYVAIVFVAGVLVLWRVRTGTFCQRCYRPAIRCSCPEDFGEPSFYDRQAGAK
jgi:hypothetical protein